MQRPFLGSKFDSQLRKSMEIKIFKDKAEVAAQFTTYLKELIVSHQGRLNIALSGGSTPKVVFDYLATHHQDIDWSSTHLYWGDERCVPPTDKQSNYKMTVDHLLSKIDIPGSNIHRIQGEIDPSAAAIAYAKQLKTDLPEAAGVPQFDLVILGMGGDGHTASIFPHEIHLWDSADTCVVATHPESGQKRVSITGTVINQAKAVVFLVTGSDKKDMMAEIHGKVPAQQEYPAAKVKPASGKLIWFLDQQANP